MEDGIGPFQLPASLDVDTFRTVHQDVGNRRVLHERLEGAEPEGLVPDLENQAVAILPAERRSFLVEESLDDTRDLSSDDLGRDDGQLAEIEAIDELTMDPRLELRVLRLGASWRGGSLPVAAAAPGGGGAFSGRDSSEDRHYFHDSRCSSDFPCRAFASLPAIDSFSARPRTFAINFERGAPDMSGRP